MRGVKTRGLPSDRPCSFSRFSFRARPGRPTKHSTKGPHSLNRCGSCPTAPVDLLLCFPLHCETIKHHAIRAAPSPSTQRKLLSITARKALFVDGPLNGSQRHSGQSKRKASGIQRLAGSRVVAFFSFSSPGCLTGHHETLDVVFQVQ